MSGRPNFANSFALDTDLIKAPTPLSPLLPADPPPPAPSLSFSSQAARVEYEAFVALQIF